MKRAVVVVSFGTTNEEALEFDIHPVEIALEKAFPDYLFRRTFTSIIVRRRLLQKGIVVEDLATVLETLRKEQIEEVFVQPTHLLYGEEYDKFKRQADSCAGLFSRFHVGVPLLSDHSALEEIVHILSDMYAPEPDRAFIFMGHGTTHWCNTVYAALDYLLKRRGRKDMFMGTVEAFPALDDVLANMDGENWSKVTLIPFMLVAGDHAVNDMAGDDADSWKVQLRAQGFTVDTVLRGLGSLEAIQRMYLEHLNALVEGPKSDR